MDTKFVGGKSPGRGRKSPGRGRKIPSPWEENPQAVLGGKYIAPLLNTRYTPFLIYEWSVQSRSGQVLRQYPSRHCAIIADLVESQKKSPVRGRKSPGRGRKVPRPVLGGKSSDLLAKLLERKYCIRLLWFPTTYIDIFICSDFAWRW